MIALCPICVQCDHVSTKKPSLSKDSSHVALRAVPRITACLWLKSQSPPTNMFKNSIWHCVMVLTLFSTSGLPTEFPEMFRQIRWEVVGRHWKRREEGENWDFEVGS